jgi:hypothetical protein
MQLSCYEFWILKNYDIQNKAANKLNFLDNSTKADH